MKPLMFEYVNYRGERSIRVIQPTKVEFGLNPHLEIPEWLLWGIDLQKHEQRSFVMSHIVRFLEDANPAPFERHFCVTTYVVNPSGDKFLMIEHKKLGKWLPPGGHVDANETPEQAALRECKEETGLDVEFVSARTQVDGGLVKPEGIQLNVIKPSEHEHMDLVYLATTSDDIPLSLNVRETSNIRWIGVEEILRPDFNTFPSIRTWIEIFTGRA